MSDWSSGHNTLKYRTSPALLEALLSYLLPAVNIGCITTFYKVSNKFLFFIFHKANLADKDSGRRSHSPSFDVIQEGEL